MTNITKELRLANWISGFTIKKDGTKRYDIPMQVVAVGETYIYADFEGNEGDVWEYDFDKIEGIPLTEEILRKCGFEERYYLEGCRTRYYLVKNKIKIQETKDNLGFQIKEGNIHKIYSVGLPINYIHQLQNIYFLLTKEELDIKL